MAQKLEKASNDLDFYKNRDDTHPLNLLYEPPVEDFYGPVNSEMRSCTDYACSLIWIVFLGFSFGYGYYAFMEVDLQRMYSSFDFRTDICGSKQLENKPYAYFLDPDNLGDISICVKECPSADDYTQQICLYDVDGQTELDDYCYDTYKTDEYMIYCMPLQIGQRRSSIEAIINTDMQIAKRIAGDFWINIELIIGAFALQLFLGLVYIFILLGRRIAHLMLWTFVTGFCVSLYFQAEYLEEEKDKIIARDCLADTDPYDCIPSHLYFLDALIWIMTITIPIYVVLLILAFHKILRMVQIMEKMLKPLRQLPYVVVIPIFVSVLQAAIAVLYMLVFIGGLNSGAPATVDAPTGFSSNSYRSIVFEVWQQRGFYVITFFYFWTLQALYYFVRCFIACACSVWYYSRDKNYLNAPILRPLWFTIRYHFGSYLYGALAIPALWMFSAVFYFWKNILEGMQRRSFLLSILLFISIPGFWIYEHAGKYISHRIYYHIAIFGDSFWESGQKVFYLRERNYSRVDMMRSSLGYVRLIGMLLISSAGSYLVYYSLFTQQLIDRYVVDVNQQIHYPIVPAMFAFITGLYISQNFTSVIDVVSEVMTFDLIADEEMFMGQQRFIDQDMLDFANKFSKEKQKKDFVITNQGRINPINDNPDINDIIKPININDLMNQDMFDEEEEPEPEQDLNEQPYDSDMDKQYDKNLKGINMDDLDNLEGQDKDKDQDYKDEIAEANKNLVQDVHQKKDLAEDVIKLDKNQQDVEKKEKKTGRNVF